LHLLLGSNRVKRKLRTFTCNEVTFSVNFSNFTSLLLSNANMVTQAAVYYAIANFVIGTLQPLHIVEHPDLIVKLCVDGHCAGV